VSETITLLRHGVDPRFQNRARQPGLDLLRALAILVVVVYHAALFGFKLPDRVDRFGWIGVDLFFVLSGYLIGGQLLAPLARDQPIKLGRFFTRRAFRIMPAYFVVLAIYFLLPSWREYPEMSQPLWKFLFSVQNIALHGGTAFSHAWSLAVEDQFYLALPFLLLLLVGRPRAAIIVPCLIVLGGLLLRTFLAWKNTSMGGGVSFRGFQAWIYYPTWTRLDPLLFGVTLAAIEKFRPNWWQRIVNCAPWLWLRSARADRLCIVSGRDRKPHRCCVRLAIPAHRYWHGRTSRLRGEPAAPALSSRYPRRRVHRQHRLQRLPDSETRHQRGRRVLHKSQHRPCLHAGPSRR
jgi:hypothetical protein